MATPYLKTTVEILDLTLNKVAEIRNLYPINKRGDVLRYSDELSDYGACTFRVSTSDPLLATTGDILEPHTYHIRIKEGAVTKWSGAIIDNPIRNKDFIEVTGAQYDFYFDKVLIRRDSETIAGDGKNNYRTFSSGTMAAAVQSLVNDAKTDFGASHPLAGMTVSSANIENPDYPASFATATGVPITGAWNFSSDVTLQFDYHSVYYVLKAFGVYANCDYEVDKDLVFYFKEYIGNKHTNITFEYGTHGNIIDYNIPRLGRRMVNDIYGIAADTDGKILHANQVDTASRLSRGLLQGAVAYSDVKDLNFLKSRLAEDLRLKKDPDSAPVNVILDENSHKIGEFGLGDMVTVRIKDHIIDYEQPRRIVGITTTIHNTGRKIIVCQTNQPLDRDMAGA